MGRSLDLGSGPQAERLASVQDPCSIALSLALMKLPKEQQNQLKPMLVASTNIFRAHIDHLHRVVAAQQEQIKKLSEMVVAHEDKLRDMPRLCPDCTMADAYCLSEGCLDPEHIEAGTECEWYKARKAEADARDGAGSEEGV